MTNISQSCAEYDMIKGCNWLILVTCIYNELVCPLHKFSEIHCKQQLNGHIGGAHGDKTFLSPLCRHTDNSRSSAPDIAVPRQAFCYLSRSNRGQNSQYRGHIAVIILDIAVKSRSKFPISRSNRGQNSSF